MAAITDLGFANAFVSGLDAQFPQLFSETAQALASRADKAAKRKKNAAAGMSNKTIREKGGTVYGYNKIQNT